MTTPVNYLYSYNLEASTFPLILDITYSELERVNPGIRRKMPFCMFQHGMNEVLNAYLLDHVKTENVDPGMMNTESPKIVIPKDMHIPELVAEYIKGFAPVTTPTGDVVKLNLPAKGRPLGPQGNITSGFFGICDAAGHNAYECYMSPAVTSALIEQTLRANQAPNEVNAFGHWNPLPNEYAPANSLATLNLLGYRLPEVLGPDLISMIDNLVFANDNTVAGRIRHCDQLMLHVSNVLYQIKDLIRITTDFPRPKINGSSIGYVTTNIEVRNTDRLANISTEVRSSIPLSKAGENRCGAFGLRRERTGEAPGPCYTTCAGDVINGWNATINANFTMIGEFAPLIGIDRMSLREACHKAANTKQSRLLTLADLNKRVFRLINN